MSDAVAAVQAKLEAIRESRDISLRQTPYLREEITDLAGNQVPLNIRYYQVQGILHLVVMKRFLLGDDTGLGKCVTGDTILWTDRGPLALRCP